MKNLLKCLCAFVALSIPALAANHLVLTNNTSAPETFMLSFLDGSTTTIVNLAVPAQSTVTFDVGNLYNQDMGYTTAGAISGWGWSGLTFQQDSTVFLYNNSDGTQSLWYQRTPTS